MTIIINTPSWTAWTRCLPRQTAGDCWGAPHFETWSSAPQSYCDTHIPGMKVTDGKKKLKFAGQV